MSMKFATGSPINLTDSGKIAIAPDGCSYMRLFKSKTEQWSCNGTTTTIDSTGAVNKSADNGFSKGQFSTPALSELDAKNSIKIISEDTAMVKLEVNIPGDYGQSLRTQVIIDKSDWLMKRLVVFVPGSGPIETGYIWQKFGSAPVLKEINTVMPMGGFVKISFSNYKRIKALPKQK